ncbi:MAG TPA: lactate permease LctP family transporter [Planctomycetota bacterium]|nr:lactate permease LctP family transporter [Planctomycetota bacterium]
MQTWTQTYTPLGSLWLSALVATIPVFALLGMLGLMHVRAHIAALIGLGCSLAIALLVYGMPARMAVAAAGYGAAFGLFPIGWIVIGAIFIFDMSVATGKFEICKHSIVALSKDRRIQALLIAFSFGAFIEGAAGFGTPVAISAAMLIGIGFRPLQAAGLALIGNTAPVAYGALGTPLITLAKITGLDVHALSSCAGRILPIFSMIVPFWIVCTMAGIRGALEIWPACLTCGLSFAAAQFYMSNFQGPMLVDVVGAIFSMFMLVVLLQFWKPKKAWQFEHEKTDVPVSTAAAVDAGSISAREKMSAWMPWVLLSVCVFAWGFQPVKDFFEGGPKDKRNFMAGVSSMEFRVAFLHNAVIRDKPVVAEATPEEAVFKFNWLSATGTGLLFAGILSGLFLGLTPLQSAKIFCRTLFRLRVPLLTIATMLALGFTTKYAGLDATMGLAFARTGWAFPFFSPLLGWLGVALTGSDTSSNVLFGNLQKLTAQQLGISPILAASANSAGGVMGKMIDAQSIVVASAATGQQGGEGAILRYVFWHSLALAILVGFVVLAMAYWFPGVVPLEPK